LKIKDFFKRIVSKGEHHMMVWAIVFANLDESITLTSISQKVGISKTHVFRIINWGMEVLRELGVECQYVSDSFGFTVSVGKAAVKTNEISKIAEKAQAMPTPKNTEMINQIILYLNEKANKNYSVEAKEAKRCINARISEGYSLNDFKKVIDIKVSKWFNTPQEDYLRPITLFGTKFNSYLNERPQHEQITQQSNIARTIAVANKVASELSGMDSE
jgi:uncharacterized phage protein (TIGR02220 family)